MSTLKEKDLRAYLKKAAEKRAAQTTVADTEVGLVKEAKEVLSRTTPEGEPIPAQPLSTVKNNQGGIGAVAIKELKGRKLTRSQVARGDPVANKKPKLGSPTPSKNSKADDGVVHWTNTLTEFTGEEKECKSLWDKRFPIPNSVFDQLVTEDDADRVAAIGPDQTATALQSYGLKIASVSRTLGSEFNKLRIQEKNNRKALEVANKSLAEHSSFVAEVARLRKMVADQPDLIQVVESLKKYLTAQRTAQEDKEAELKRIYSETVTEWNEKYTSVHLQLEQRSASLKGKDAEIEDLKVGAAEFLMNGFDQAKAQVELLYP